jgi:hypothetical protein
MIEKYLPAKNAFVYLSIAGYNSRMRIKGVIQLGGDE